MANPLQQAYELGQSIWIDSLSRTSTREGDLQELVDRGVVGVTSNPTIFAKALSDSEVYDEQLSEVSEHEDDPKEIFWELARVDIQEACDVLAPVYERTERRDGYVSLEVSPDVAYDSLATFEEATHLHEMVDRENLMVKIPATLPGLGAIEDMIANGRSINVTLIFSLQRYRAVAKAYVQGLHRLVAAGGDPSGVASVASFFVSRVDSEVDKRIDALGAPQELKGRLGVANAKLAYEAFEEIFSGSDWEFLASKGATAQRPLWASTSTKNPDYPELIYVENLIGPHTVNTMPRETLESFADHGEVRDTVRDDIEGAHRLIDELAAAGVDYDDVTETLEREGVQKFVDSFNELLEALEAQPAAKV